MTYGNVLFISKSMIKPCPVETYSNVLLQGFPSQFLELLFDLYHVNLTSGHHHAHQRVIVRADTLHRLLELTGKVVELVLHTAYWNSSIGGIECDWLLYIDL